MEHIKKSVLSVLVENQFGVLSRITGLFSRRGFNIDSLSVGVTENPEFSRITIAVNGDDQVINQIIKQVEKLIDVVEVTELIPDESVYREISLIKVATNSNNRAEVVGIVDIFRAKIVDVASNSITVEVTGEGKKVDALCDLMRDYGIIEIARTGLTALGRGDKINSI